MWAITYRPCPPTLTSSRLAWAPRASWVRRARCPKRAADAGLRCALRSTEPRPSVVGCYTHAAEDGRTEAVESSRGLWVNGVYRPKTMGPYGGSSAAALGRTLEFRCPPLFATCCRLNHKATTSATQASHQHLEPHTSGVRLNLGCPRAHNRTAGRAPCARSPCLRKHALGSACPAWGKLRESVPHLPTTVSRRCVALTAPVRPAVYRSRRAPRSPRPAWILALKHSPWRLCAG